METWTAGASWQDSGLVFTTQRGTPVEPDNLRRSWYQIRKVLGEPPVRFHDLRHTCVSLLLDLGVSPHIVKEIVGHFGHRRDDDDLRPYIAGQQPREGRLTASRSWIVSLIVPWVGLLR
jgi:integrase